VAAIGWPLRSSILRNVVARYPAIVPALEPMSSAEQTRAIRDRQLDMGVVWYARKGRIVDSMLETMVLSEAETVLAMGVGHPLAKRKQVSVELLAGETVIMAHRRENPEIHDRLVDASKRLGITPNILYRNGSGIIDMVAAGIGVSYMASMSPLALRPDIVVRPFRQSVMSAQLALVWRRDNKLPALSGFLEVVTALKKSGQL
jgi:DNA-binding transcriptional LysR family regulator